MASRCTAQPYRTGGQMLERMAERERAACRRQGDPGEGAGLVRLALAAACTWFPLRSHRIPYCPHPGFGPVTVFYPTTAPAVPVRRIHAERRGRRHPPRAADA
jgi:hypothetical protein